MVKILKLLIQELASNMDDALANDDDDDEYDDDEDSGEDEGIEDINGLAENGSR